MYLPHRVRPTPSQIPLADALRRDVGLSNLLRMAQASNQRLKALEGVVPAVLLAQIQAGKLDQQQWHIVVRSSALANKLRHYVPLIEDDLIRLGHAPCEVVVRLLPG